MRRNALAIFFCLIVTGSSSVLRAQIIITTPYEFSYGVSAGTTFSSFTFNPSVTQTTLIGTTFGLTGRLSTGENVGLQVELNYSQQGWKEEFEETPEYTYSRRLDYLQLPFYTHIQFGGKKVKGFLNVGPQIGYLIAESTNQNLNGAAPGKVNSQHTMPVEKKFEWGISGGAGIEVRTGIGYFLIEGRYLYSLGDIYRTTSADNFAKASGQTITAKVSYLIPRKK
jgi:hypothetical protein